jgi:hypothetical protein
MHVCLCIPEILAMICDELAPCDDLDARFRYPGSAREGFAYLLRTSFECVMEWPLDHIVTSEMYAI